MVVNEKALVREMKAAYKEGGYTVAVWDGDWVISGTGWTVIVEGIGNVPREALSLIVLHMGFLPENGEAWEIFKGDNGPLIQKRVFEEAIEQVRRMEAEAEDAPANSEVRPTGLWLGNVRVWQRVADLKTILVSPRSSGIMKELKNVIVAGLWLALEGEISTVYIRAEDSLGREAKLEHLSRMRWIAE